MDVTRLTASQLIDDTIAALERLLPELTTREDLVARHFPALCLARATRMLVAMRSLVNDDVCDTIGIAVRPLTEQLIIGMHVLFGGGDALLEVEGAHARHVALWFSANEIDFNPPYEIEHRTLNLKVIAEKLAPMMARHGEGEDGLRLLYDLMFRGESTFSIHGAGPAHGHLDRSHQGRWGVIVAPARETAEASETILLASAYTLIFARHVLRTFGFAAGTVDDLTDRISAFFDARLRPEAGSDDSQMLAE